MRNVSLIIFLALSSGVSQAQIQPQSLGIRLGDPLGITYKKYFQGDQSIEFIVGTASRNWHYQYYQNSFDHISAFDRDVYVSHAVQSTVYLQGRYLLSYPIILEGLEGKLDWYWGLGGMLKAANVRYRLQDAVVSEPVRTESRTDFDIGPEGIIGLEYDFYGAPFTAFGEGSVVIELLDRPLIVRPFAALGIRVKL